MFGSKRDGDSTTDLQRVCSGGGSAGSNVMYYLWGGVKGLHYRGRSTLPKRKKTLKNKLLQGSSRGNDAVVGS